jgi:glycosyltransferase involved in cell wall biosynthesis
LTHHIGIDVRKLTDFGIGTYIRHLVAALAEIDEENQYVLFSRPEHRHRLEPLPENFRVVDEASPVYSMRELLTLSWRLLRTRLDLYHSTHYVLPALVPCKVVVTIHDIIHLLYPQFLPNALAFFYANRMIRRSLARADRVIADSQNTKTDLMRYFEIDGEKIQVIYPGVSDRFRRANAAADEQERLRKLGIDRPYVLFVGNPKPHKNLDNIVAAYAQARKAADFNADLVCVGGESPETGRVRLRARKLGIEQHLRFLGRLPDEDLPIVYRGARLFLYPTLYEGFGLPVVEAMASGVPVVTSNKSALREIAQGYADLVDPLDINGMSRAIVECMTDDDHHGALVKLGERRAADFDWRRTAQRTLELYRAALGNGGA